MKTLKKGLFILMASLMLFSGISVSTETAAQAGTQTFVLPDETKSNPVNLINGDFEVPAKHSMYVDTSKVPGWDAARSHLMQFGGAYHGKQGCEVVSDMPQRVFQVVTVVPGTRLLWSFASTSYYSYNGSYPKPTQHDVTHFYVYPVGASGISAYVVQTATPWKWTVYRGTYTVPTGMTSAVVGFQPVSTWTGAYYWGSWVDYVFFETSSKLIAKKSIKTSAADNSTALKGEIVTVSVAVTNWGETDASRCVFRDVLSDGLDYIAGSATINGAAAGSLATFDAATDELRVNFGTGATAGTANTNGGRLLGSQSMGTAGTTGQGQTATISFQARVTADAGYVVKNQANVTYNDYEFESYNASDYTCYSSVSGQTPAAGNEATYVNRFTVLDRTFSGRAWYDANADGMIDTAETRASGLTVSLYNSTDTAYAAPAKNLYGNPLTTTTNTNGEYTFTYIPYGTYKAVITTPSGQVVTLKTLSTDNDAAAEGTRAVAGAYNLNTPVSVSNCDFGFATPSLISGRVWIDMDADGMIGAGETRASGLTVRLFQNSDTAYTTPVNNLYGNPLVTTTNANGEYSLSAIPAGTYKVVITTPSGYVVTVKTVTTDNDAVAEGTRAVIGGISLGSTDAMTDQDFGFIPQAMVNKTAEVNSNGIDNGTAASPVPVSVGDTIEYTINAQWSGTYGSPSGVTISDTIPAGLSLVTTAGSYTPGMTWSTDAGTGLTTVTWENQTLISGLNQYKFKVTVNTPSAGASATTYVNSATVAVGASSQTTNSTYHIMNKRSITLSKTVGGTLGDPNQSFTFRIYLTGVTGSLPYVGGSSVSGVSAPANGTISNGGTVSLKHGQYIKINDVPVGTAYTINETNGSGYTVTIRDNNASGTVTDDVSVAFVNTKNEVMPTGVMMDVLPYGLIVALAAGIIAVFLVMRSRKKHPKRTGPDSSNGSGDYRCL